MRLLLRQLVVAAATTGEVADTPQRILILDLDSAGVVDGLTVATHARLLPMDSRHERILPREKEPCGAIDEAGFVLEKIDERWPAGVGRER